MLFNDIQQYLFPDFDPEGGKHAGAKFGGGGGGGGGRDVILMVGLVNSSGGGANQSLGMAPGPLK